MYQRRICHSLSKATSLAVLALGAILYHPRAHAAPAPVPVAVSQPVPEPVPESALGPKIDSAALEAQRGGTDTVNNNMQLDGSVHDNVAHQVVTGSNSIDAGSFANMAGIPTVIQNTGANVLIQSATIINLQFK